MSFISGDGYNQGIGLYLWSRSIRCGHQSNTQWKLFEETPIPQPVTWTIQVLHSNKAWRHLKVTACDKTNLNSFPLLTIQPGVSHRKVDKHHHLSATAAELKPFSMVMTLIVPDLPHIQSSALWFLLWYQSVCWVKMSPQVSHNSRYLHIKFQCSRTSSSSSF